jgi:hypothetical protein
MLEPKPLQASTRRLPDQGEASLFPALRSATHMGVGMIAGAGADKIILIVDAASQAICSDARRGCSPGTRRVMSRGSLLYCTNHRPRACAVKPAGALCGPSPKWNQCFARLSGESSPIQKSSIDAAFICRISSQESVDLLSAGGK